ncbi:MAG: nuclear transport factor 2 family protein [Chloroflexota bacterium]|nr:nuclear transport factor 2 family protein [Chloroflexota bacterium]
MAADQGVIEAFVAAWHARDVADLRELLERCWADDGVLTLPDGAYAGRDAVAAQIVRVTEQWSAGARVQISAVEEHHGWLRYRWVISAPNGPIFAQGLHVGERAADGRLRRIVAFYGMPPQVD